jgi:hypothetical protein
MAEARALVTAFPKHAAQAGEASHGTFMLHLLAYSITSNLERERKS